jgi:hypothetical protein
MSIKKVTALMLACDASEIFALDLKQNISTYIPLPKKFFQCPSRDKLSCQHRQQLIAPVANPF